MPTSFAPALARCRALLVAACTGACGLAAAQPAAAPTARAEAPQPKVERLVHSDGYSRIEELRIGGRTRSIEVQTRSALPGYEVRPIDPAQDDRRSGAGQRQWRVLAF